MFANATPDTFRPHIATKFAIDVEDGEPLVLTLEDVQVHGAGHELRTEPFTLVFTGPPDRLAPQATLTLHHQELGSFAVFLVPVDIGRYEAVFN